MKRANYLQASILLLGDALAFFVALFLALTLRDLVLPGSELFILHAYSFFPLLCILILFYIIAGLYEERVIVVESVPKLVLNTHLIWGIIAVFYFYLVPESDISPKITLLLFVVTLSVTILLWRLLHSRVLHGREKEKSILVGSGQDIEDLFREVNTSKRSPFTFSEIITPENMLSPISLSSASFIAVDFGNSAARSLLHTKLPQNVSVVDARLLYEHVFERIPLSLIDEAWLLSNISFAPKPVYDFLKRAMDISIASVLWVLSLVLYPFVWVSIKVSDKTPLGIFIRQPRVGKGGTTMENIKFRTMTVNVFDKWVKDQGQVTPIGKFLRTTRIDELPQLWNVLRGDLSLIGPRPDIVGLGKTLETQIPFYRFRTAIKPGLSGWAQISQKLPPQSVEETRLRLAYDLYYIKNRSLFLDLKIALRTIKTLLLRVGM